MDGLAGGAGEGGDAGVLVVGDGPAAVVDEVVVGVAQRYAVDDVGSNLFSTHWMWWIS